MNLPEVSLFLGGSFICIKSKIFGIWAGKTQIMFFDSSKLVEWNRIVDLDDKFFALLLCSENNKY